jgi:hypothetical protein
MTGSRRPGLGDQHDSKTVRVRDSDADPIPIRIGTPDGLDVQSTKRLIDRLAATEK